MPPIIPVKMKYIRIPGFNCGCIQVISKLVYNVTCWKEFPRQHGDLRAIVGV